MLKAKKLKISDVPEELRGELGEVLATLRKKTIRKDAVVLVEFEVAHEASYEDLLAFLKRRFENVLVGSEKTAIFVVPMDHDHDHLSAKTMFSRDAWENLVTEYILDVFGFKMCPENVKEDIVRKSVARVAYMDYFFRGLPDAWEKWEDFQKLMHGAIRSRTSG